MDLLPLNDIYRAYSPTGSRVINPPSYGSDEDWLVLVSDLQRAEVDLQAKGFVPDCAFCIGTQYGDDWRSFRKGDLNLIVTADGQWFERSQLATDVATRLGLKSRNDRVRLFKLIREIGRD